MKKIELTQKELGKLFSPDTKAKKLKRQSYLAFRYVVAFALLYGLFFVLINASAYWVRIKYTLDKPVAVQTATPIPSVTPVATPSYTGSPQIIISKIGLTAPIIMNSDPNNILEDLKNGVAQYRDTALPGQVGNVVIVGHSSDYPWHPGSYKTIFALLDKLAVGDTITINYAPTIYTYQITGSRVVAATEISVLAKTDSPTLTLITCYPVGTARNRLIITAKLTSNNATTTQLTDPLGGQIPTIR